MGASLLLVEAVCLLSGRGSGLGPTADPISFASPKEMGERKGEPCRRLVRLNSRRSCVALVKQAAGNQIFYVQARQSYSWRAGWHKRCALHSLACLRERAGVRAAFTPSPAGGRRGWGRCCFLFGRCAWFEAGGRVSARQPTPFLLRRQKK